MRRCLLFSVAACLAACSTTPYARASRADTAQAYRVFLREHPRDDNVDLALQRLAELEFREASKRHTVVAYKRFLEEFPRAEEAKKARALLEGLRFNAARADGSARSLRLFLQEHPDGAHRAEADKLLSDAELREVSGVSERRELERVIAQHRDDPRADAAQTRLDDTVYQAAVASGAGSLLAYLREFPSGAHRDEARRRLLELKLEGLLFSGLIEEARKEQQRSPLASTLPELEVRFRRAEELRALTRSRDPRILGALPQHYLRSIEDLQGALNAPDPLDRWQAAEELGQHASVQSIDLLLSAIRTARNPLVRQRAFESLGMVLRSLPRSVADYEIATRVDALRTKAGSSELFLTLAVLLDLGGRLEQAATEYRKAFDPGEPDPVVLRRWAQIRRERNQLFSAATAARRLALWAGDSASLREGSGGLLLGARQLCAAWEAAAHALEVVQAARRGHTEFPEDLQEFESRAREAQRVTEARLRDLELALQEREPGARSCRDRSVAERLAAGEREREAALRQLPAKAPRQAPAVLALARERDPSLRLRALAAELEGSLVRRK